MDKILDRRTAADADVLIALHHLLIGHFLGFGQHIGLKPGIDPLMGFQSEQLIYLSSQYYNPKIGQFINADDESLLTATQNAFTDKNHYAYCDNNPVVRADNDGEFCNVIIGAGVGAVVGLAGQLVSDLVTSAVNRKFTFSNCQSYTEHFLEVQPEELYWEVLVI